MASNMLKVTGVSTRITSVFAVKCDFTVVSDFAQRAVAVESLRFCCIISVLHPNAIDRISIVTSNNASALFS